MRKIIQWIFSRPIRWIALKVSSAPRRDEIFNALSALYRNISEKNSGGKILPLYTTKGRYIIFSDQHKGTRDQADDFRWAEENYMCALQYYYDQGYTLIILGDAEELWENTPQAVIDKNRLNLLEEAKFLQLNRYHRVYGNHDLEWKYQVPRFLYLKPIFGDKLSISEGLILRGAVGGRELDIFMTHGHQGDRKSDGNAFSMWFVAAIWTPIQRFLNISINTIADSFELVDKHNILMYEWSATQKNMIFISGHTHKPVFASMDHIDRLGAELQLAESLEQHEKVEGIREEIERRKKEYAGKHLVKTMAVPSYFNTGCCCFVDGDITGIEICDGEISLVKWKQSAEQPKPYRTLLERASLHYIASQLTS